MRWRRPPFALVLVAILAPVALILALSSHSNSPQNQPSFIGEGPASACLTPRAIAKATVTSTVTEQAVVQLPVVVTERVVSRGGVTSATRSETIVERATASRRIQVSRAGLASHRTCARGSSIQAARSIALSRGYQIALAQARNKAKLGAQAQLTSVSARISASVLDDARKLATDRARALAPSVRSRLATQALADANARASGH